MQSISNTVKALKVGEPTVFKNLAMFPIVNGNRREADYLVLDEALAAGSARVTEVSDGGSVPELKFVNSGKSPVFLLDGEELVGAKQNRVLNLSILVLAGKTVVIPVSCVEAGRWSPRSAEFESSDHAYFAFGRAKKMSQVTFSLRRGSSRRSDQSEVWDDISEKAERMHAASPTGAMAAMYEQYRASIEDYVHAFSALETQAGALFTIDGKIVGFDLFDCTATLRKLLPKLVRSYALDALDAVRPGAGADAAAASREQVEEFLHSVAAARMEEFPAVGEGYDVRLTGNNLTGAALVVGDRVIHLSGFYVPGTQEGRTDRRRSEGAAMSRSSVRRWRRFFGMS